VTLFGVDIGDKEFGKRGDAMVTKTRAKTWTSDRIKWLRKQHNETQAEFCQRLGVAVHTLRFWEQGQGKPNGSAIVLLSRLEEDITIGKPRAMRTT